MESAKEPRKALGRGLAALIPQGKPATAPQAGLRELPVERIHPSRRQPRKFFDDERLDALEASGVLSSRLPDA